MATAYAVIPRCECIRIRLDLDCGSRYACPLGGVASGDLEQVLPFDLARGTQGDLGHVYEACAHARTARDLTRVVTYDVDRMK